MWLILCILQRLSAFLISTPKWCRLKQLRHRKGGNNWLETLQKEELGHGLWKQGSLCRYPFSLQWHHLVYFQQALHVQENLHLISAEICFQFRIWVSRLTCEHLKDSTSLWHNVPQRPVGRQQRNGQWLASCQWSKVLMWLWKPTWENWEGKREEPGYCGGGEMLWGELYKLKWVFKDEIWRGTG